MQEPNGSMRTLTEEEIKIDPALLQHPKVLREDGYFKINRCYFKIAKIMPDGIEAKGVSRREYFESKRR